MHYGHVDVKHGKRLAKVLFLSVKTKIFCLFIEKMIFRRDFYGSKIFILPLPRNKKYIPNLNYIDHERL
ncbi:MAG TPA: hypothetical protein DEQ30_08325 [Porphyromonadaceae bacterium]|nr:hypothetical protein [Porphyromonadaceae bacterium]